MSKSYLAIAAIPVALAVAALTGGSAVLAAQVDAPAASPAPALDDATIVAIFDNANSFDMRPASLQPSVVSPTKCASSEPCSREITQWFASRGATWLRSSV